MTVRERFAPSPTGFLHLGHAFSALTAWDAAQAGGGTFLLRIEDIDRARCRPEYEAAIFDDLRWLGLSWPEPVLRQSARFAAYRAALDRLAARGLLFPCSCSRRDIARALSAPQEGDAPHGPYPGTCRNRPLSDRRPGDALRLHMDRAIAELGGDDAVAALSWTELGRGRPETRHLDAGALRQDHGDVVLARRDIGTSYHLAVVVDDAAQQITHVTRGADMAEFTPVHRLLQALLDLPVPLWRHHRLIRDDKGRRLAKRDDARAIRRYREQGATPADIRAMLGMEGGAAELRPASAAHGTDAPEDRGVRSGAHPRPAPPRNRQ